MEPIARHSFRRVPCFSKEEKKAPPVERIAIYFGILARCFTIFTWRTRQIVGPSPCPGDERRLRERVDGVELSGSNVG